MGPGPAVSASPGHLLEMHVLGPYPRLTESETLGGQQSVFKEPPQVILIPTQIENHGLRV